MAHEWVYPRPGENGIEQKKRLAECFEWYNRHRPHQSLHCGRRNESDFGALDSAQPQAA